MILYAKIENEETGLCTVGTGTNNAFYRSMGMQPLEVQQSDVDGFWYLKDKCPMKTDEEKAEEERERLNILSMTRGDMFEAIILAFGKTKADIRSMIENVEGLTDIERALYLNRFDEALDFYRGYPAVDLIGKMLGVSSEQLDKFFETKDYTYLIPSDQVSEKSDQVSDQVENTSSIEQA